MSLKKNIAANYISQLYVAGIGILILPLYIKYMGAEAYGLVGFFTMLQAWFALLDLGLTPTIGRETARYRGGSMSALQYRQLFRALSLIFLAIAVVGGTALFVLAEPIANEWLNVKELSMQQVILAVQIMAVSVALRWMGGLYRGVVTGSEKLVWLSGFNVLIATLRFIAVFASMKIYGFTPFVFFWHQLAVAVLEVVGLWWMGNILLPTKRSLDQPIGWSFSPIRPVLRFALTIAFTSSVWVLVTQTDKLILSGILPLDEYGFFTLAVMVASGIMIITVPLNNAIQPRLTRMYAEGNINELYDLYVTAAKLTSIFPFVIAMIIAFYPYDFMIFWSGDKDIASGTSEILRYYVLGSGFLSLAAFPSILQNAYGNLRYHFIGNLIMLFTLIPMSIYFSLSYGAIGAAYVWFSLNFFYLLIWVSYSHYRLMPGKAAAWFVDAFLKPVSLFFIVLMCTKLFMVHGSVNRIDAFLKLFLVTIIAYGCWYLILGRTFVLRFIKVVY